MAEYLNTAVTVVVTVVALHCVPPILKALFPQGLVPIRRRIAGWFGSSQETEVEEKQDVLYVFMFPRNFTRQMLNMSPFAVKLESILRLHQIPYEVIETTKFSQSTHQIPYIRYNGREVADTHFILEFISTTFQVDLLQGLSPTQRATTHAFHRMLDENTALTYLVYRYHFAPNEFLRVFRIGTSKFISKQVLNRTGSGMFNRASIAGMGRMGEAGIGHIGQNDVRAVSQYLANNTFLMGDNPTMIDCIVFAHLSHCILVTDVNFPHKKVLEECDNLLPYLERVKQKLWPDWKDLVNEDTFE